ncbi:MAG: HAD hydrolase-like protein [Bacteroidales bacterium]
MESNKILIAFDLDDTLYKEIEFVKSAYRHISNYINNSYGINIQESFNILYNAYKSNKNPFDTLLDSHPIITESAMDLVELYRYHTPTITLDHETTQLLEQLNTAGYTLAIITDGRSRTQRNKISALELLSYIDNENIIISEEIGSDKTNIRNFLYFNDSYTTLYYVGDNPRKDFLNPNTLNWHTIMLRDSGENIHTQEIQLSENHHAEYLIDTIAEVATIIETNNPD